MTSPRMLDLPEEWAIPMNTLVDLVRDQSTTTLEMADRIARQKVVPKSATGHKAPRLTRLAGMYAAAAILLSIQDKPAMERTLWDQAIVDTVTPEVLHGWDFDRRTYAALALRATFKDLPTPYPPQSLEAGLLASWFLHTSGHNLPRTGARLASHVLEHHAHHAPDLWTAVHDRAPRIEQPELIAGSTAPGDLRARLVTLYEQAQSHAVAHARMIELGGGMGELGYHHREMFEDMLTWDRASTNDHAETVQDLAGFAVAALDLADKWVRLAGYNLVPGARTPARVRGEAQLDAAHELRALLTAHPAPTLPTDSAHQDPVRVQTLEQLTALPAECLLRSERPGCGPTYLLTYDAGDGEIMYTTTGGEHPSGFLTAAEALEFHGPFELIHHGTPNLERANMDPDSGRADHDPWGALSA